MYDLTKIKIWMPRADNCKSTRKQKIYILTPDVSKIMDCVVIDMKHGDYTPKAKQTVIEMFGTLNYYGSVVNGHNLTEVQFKYDLKNSVNTMIDGDGTQVFKHMSKLKFDLIMMKKQRELQEFLNK